ncbi:MAG: APC family permease [Actinomycetia bacterium]|nr:APC family permease [Actinomycetes bacterium]
MIKRALLGRPVATAEEMEERLPKKLALPVFASDAISSTAYATEEILLALVLAGSAAASFSIYVAIAVVVLLVFVALSYQQTVHAYPNGGGSYVVSRENLGLFPGMLAAGSLMVDYVMTVAVSVASGVAAIDAAFPALEAHRVWICIGLIVLVTIANLRGVRESGRFFSIPTYAFVLLCGGLVIVGLIRWRMGDLELRPVPAGTTALEGAALLWIVLRAFSGGCSAMTGTEAISNAVPAFKPPESKNASITLGVMAAILAFLLLGVTALSQILHIVPQDGTTVLGEIGHVVYGGGFFYYALQIATMAILILAANTSFTGFPRLASVLARDGLMPRQFMNRGDKLVFSNGIIGLMVAAIAILVIYKARVHSLIPLYAVGVFTSFTLSQSGMVVRWFRLRTQGWQRRALMNGFGALLTGIVTVVVLVTKFTHGAYIVLIAVAVLIAGFYAVRRHYLRVARFLMPQDPEQLARLGRVAVSRPRTTVVLFVSQVNELTARALALGRGLSPDDFHAVTIANDPERVLALQRTWEEMGIDVPLLVVDSPYREFTRPATEYIRSLRPSAKHTVTVIIPEFVVEHWWENFLHNQDALRLKAALLGVPWVVVINIPFHIGAAADTAPEGTGGVG